MQKSMLGIDDRAGPGVAPAGAREIRLVLGFLAAAVVGWLLLLYVFSQARLVPWSFIASIAGPFGGQVLNPNVGPRMVRMLTSEAMAFSVVVGGSLLVFASGAARRVVGDGTLVVFRRLIGVAWLPVIAALYLLTRVSPRSLAASFPLHGDSISLTAPSLAGVVFFGLLALALAPRPSRRYLPVALDVFAELAPIALGVGVTMTLDRLYAPDGRPWSGYFGDVVVIQLTLATAEMAFVLAVVEAALADLWDVRLAQRTVKLPSWITRWYLAATAPPTGRWEPILRRSRALVPHVAAVFRAYAVLPLEARMGLRLGLFAFPIVAGLWLATFYQLGYASTILDRQGRLLQYYHRDQPLRLYIAPADVSPWLLQAIDATEDPGVYASPATHAPVSPARFASIFAGATEAIGGGGGELSGGSGIAVQSCKNLVGRSVSDDVWDLPDWLPGRQYLAVLTTLAQKFAFEFPCGWTFERSSLLLGGHRSPAAFYLSQIYLGQGVYGIEAASQTYFGKSAADLTLTEAAMLAGLPQAPSYLDPWVRPDAVRARRHQVLSAMVREGYLSEDQAAKVDAAPLGVLAAPYRPPVFSANFVDNGLMDWADAHGYHHMSTDGLVVTTSLDLAEQRQVANDLAATVSALSDRDINDGAALVIDPRTGEIHVWIGESPLGGEPLTQLDLVSQFPHQPGSAIKPLLYSCAMEMGALKPDDKLDDTQRTIGGKYVANWDLKSHGILPASEALAQSSNVAAAEITDRLTPAGFAQCLHDVFQVRANLHPDQNGVFLGIGLAGLPMTEVASAYTALANGGTYRPLTPVHRIATRDGRVLYEVDPAQSGDPVMNCATASWLAKTLLKVSQIIGVPGGYDTKTGTTPASSFAVGYGRDVVFVAWLGNVTTGGISLATDDVFGREGGGEVWRRWAARHVAAGATNAPISCGNG
jgi:membrane peptidoglycan carboxypeptidase